MLILRDKEIILLFLVFTLTISALFDPFCVFYSMQNFPINIGKWMG